VTQSIAPKTGDRLILRGADGYDEARFARVFNARRPERYPAALLVAESEDDVVEGVRWLLIDLGAFKETALDESTRLVSVTPSVSGGELNAHLSGYGRFFTTGDCPSLGLGGFLLQGGVGIGFRGWGYAAEQIASIDVVTADGELVTADEQNNSDLFWAARGAGPGFCGAITRFHLKTRPVPAGLAATTHIYPLARTSRLGTSRQFFGGGTSAGTDAGCGQPKRGHVGAQSRGSKALRSMPA
jgi:FAD binding domain